MIFRWGLACLFVGSSAHANAVATHLERKPERAGLPSRIDLLPKLSCPVRRPAPTPASATKASSESPVVQFDRLMEVVNSLPPGTPFVPLVRDYKDLLGISSYKGEILTENAGLVGYASRLVNGDRNFAKRTFAFYADIGRVDGAGDEMSTSDPVAISEQTGRGDRRNLQPGWLWRLALKHGDGNANLAMRLLGVCGHDDVARDIPLIPSGIHAGFCRDREKGRIQEERRQIQRVIEEVGANTALAPAARQSRLNQLRAELHALDLALKLADTQPAQACSFVCPAASSAMFAPRALGDRVDIPETLKQRIIGLKEEGKDTSAKTYHFYGAAWLACEMVGRGHDANLVAFLQSFLGWAYRLDYFNSKYCVYRRAPFHKNDLKGEDESGEAQDIATLADRWALGGERVGEGILVPQTNLQLRFPGWVRRTSFGKSLDRPPGWSEERFRRAEHGFREYMADWDWTVEQHAVGGRFALEHCRKTPRVKK